MRCCDCEFRNSCKDEDTVLTSFVRCSIREEKLKKKAKQPEEYIKKSDLKNIGDVPYFDGRNGLNFDQHQTLVACCKAFREFVDQLPTADVVPRAEVMRLVGECYDKCDECRSKITDTVRAEIAKEIFEEIITTVFSKMPSDVLIVGRNCDFTDGIRMGKREAVIDMINTLAELKKKYTEGKQ